MPGKRLPAEVRFNALVDKTEDHWNWKGYKLPNGYGRFSYKSKAEYAHHYAWFARHGKWPNSRDRILHTCGLAGCVNPDHLELRRKKASRESE